MPIYEYACAACGEQFSKLQKMGGEGGTVCPKCGSNDVQRQISGCSIGSAGGGTASGPACGMGGGMGGG